MEGKKMKRRTMYIRMVSGSLLRRRSRMFVALLAVAVGATILSGLITIYYDIPRQMGKEFRSYGANLILLPGGDAKTISEATADDVKARLSGDELVGVASYRYYMIKINEQPFMAAGTELSEAEKTSPYWYVTGDWPAKDGEALIGKEVADVIRLTPGSSFTINGSDVNDESFSKAFTVSGIVETGGSEEAFVFMSVADLAEATGASDGFDVVECSISATRDELENIAANLGAEIPGITPRLVQKVTQSEDTVLSKLQALVYLVTVVVLVLTMICVATTMMAVVTERRKEIGLRKALGASNGSVIAEFFGEGIFIGVLGGALGVVLGYFFAQLVGVNVFSRTVSFQPLFIPITLLASIVVTSLACVIPVRRATDVDPAIVLRGE
jgi:putative ABC transport system permease protein